MAFDIKAVYICFFPTSPGKIQSLELLLFLELTPVYFLFLFFFLHKTSYLELDTESRNVLTILECKNAS